MSTGNKVKAVLESYEEVIVDFSSCSEYRDWHKHWLHLDKNGKYYAYEPDNTCISEGTLLEACIALNNSKYDG